MKVKFWGTRGSIAVPGKDTTRFGGNTTCVEINLESGLRILIDSGTGIRPLGEELLANGESLDIHLLITHIHWDHITGFPFFAPIFRPEARITIDGYPTCMKGLRVPFDNRLGDGFFPIGFDALKADIRYLDRVHRGPLELDGVVIRGVPLQHPQGGLGYRFQEGDKSLVFITDNELTVDSWAGRHPDDFARFCEGADILIHDAQYTPAERSGRIGWGHSDHDATVRLAIQSGVRRLILFHHDPSRTDQELAKLVQHCRSLASESRAGLQVEAAREGHSFVL